MNRAALFLACAVAVTLAACGTDSLPNTRWVATHLGGHPVLPDKSPTLDFSGEGRVSGNGGCNRYSGQASLSGNRLELGPLMSTKMACADPESNNQESAMLAALEATRSFRKDGADLILIDGAGNAVARFKPL